MSRPDPGQYAPFFQRYIDLTTGESVTLLPELYKTKIEAFFRSLPLEKSDFSYAAGKWTLKQVLQHLLDVERVFVFRLLWIVRGDRQPLPGFDENSFAQQAPAIHRSLEDMVREWLSLRASTDTFIDSLSATDWNKIGLVDGSAITANALGFIIYGHIIHHMTIISERYIS